MYIYDFAYTYFFIRKRKALTTPLIFISAICDVYFDWNIFVEYKIVNVLYSIVMFNIKI